MSRSKMFDTLPEGKHDNLFTYSKGFISQANGGPIPQPLLQKYSPGAKALRCWSRLYNTWDRTRQASDEGQGRKLNTSSEGVGDTWAARNVPPTNLPLI